MNVFQNINTTLTDLAEQMSSIAAPAMVVIIIALGFLWMSGDRGAGKAKSWAWYVAIGGFIIFGASLIVSTLRNVYGF
ncbi:TrbC/VirB2 family protein [Enterococcus cecorum]|uniref:TrbC/VirB2 family protein n=1 Tax=Enterococcus cecorum TaxID=44008 RepID=UPI000642E67C|nr:TrbC/VirB2 family protein [Enterococcus cecorum]KLO73207.1 hypothetical protein AA989_08410 [Enterococcus cecorum]MCJ0578232.1 TrbC/VirB2 family protein [Enterococcus cecorum]MCJ0582716.1 TrbC/VirB2 family protein [Enterococcus cecorum]MCJ0585953.1 TrbC/VirB2 family protein [Enterococcus cecorum]CAI3299156.1 TrbC/VirB2 family protein [Enterococcus cecorum]